VVFPSPSPSPSTQPVYQLRIEETTNLCVSENCVERNPWDNVTVQLNYFFQRSVIDTDDGTVILTEPPVDEYLFAPPNDEITLYAKTLEPCYDPMSTVTCQRAFDPTFPQAIRDRALQFCADCVNEDWVPIWFIGPDGTDYSPKKTPGNVYPNAQGFETIAGVVDCRRIYQGLYPVQQQSIKYTMYPMGPTRTNDDGSIYYDEDGKSEGGPCWDDPEYGEVVCANGGGSLPPGTLEYPDFVPTPVVRDINGENFPRERDSNGQRPRHLQFNCPQGSAKEDTDDHMKMLF